MQGRGGRKRERGEEREKREVTRGDSSGCWCFPREVVQGEESQERTDLAKDPEKGMVHAWERCALLCLVISAAPAQGPHRDHTASQCLERAPFVSSSHPLARK